MTLVNQLLQHDAMFAASNYEDPVNFSKDGVDAVMPLKIYYASKLVLQCALSSFTVLAAPFAEAANVTSRPD